MKDTLREERQATHWRTVYADCISDKGPALRICEELSKLKDKKNPIRKWAKYMKIYFTKEKL